MLITLLGVTVGGWIYQDIKEERIKDINYTSAVIKRYYELSFNQWRNSLLSLGQQLVEIQGEGKEQRRLDIVNKTIVNYEELMAFGFADTTGQVMTFSGLDVNDSLPNLVLSKNSRRSFLKAKEVDRLSIGESYYFANVDDWILPVRVPIRDDNGVLQAVNTTAIQYKSLNRELASFGFDSSYRIHLINKDFNTTQLYYPYPITEYAKILQHDADIYTDENDHASNDISYFLAFNSLEGHQSLGLRSILPSINHELVVTVDNGIIWDEMQTYVIFILLIYTTLSVLLVFSYLYSSKKEKDYINQVQDREANLKAIFESTNSIIGLFDREKRLVEYNQSFASYAKQTDGLVLTKDMDVFGQMSGPLVKVMQGFQDRALKGEKFKETLEYPTSDGSLYFSFSYQPVYKGDEITGISMFVEDITALKQSQVELEKHSKNLEEVVEKRTEELEQKNTALEHGNKELAVAIRELKDAQTQLIQVEKMASLGVMSAGIGHEINNPLNFIKNGLSALNQELIDNNYEQIDRVVPYFDIINDGVSRASKIVKSLSHFSRDHKTMDENCKVDEIIDHCLVILHSNLKNRVEVIKQFEHGKKVVLGNEGKLHQAFLNILSNAEQAIKDMGKITIDTIAKKDNIVITIKDNGSGIDKGNLEKIGDPFFTTKDPGKGTGLGLFLTYSIIDEHNGKIIVNSKENEGTSFEITLPTINI
jgi:PAS domain S-box-containing protein